MVEKPVDRQSTSLLSHLLDHVVETPRGIAFLGTLSICAVGSAIWYGPGPKYSPLFLLVYLCVRTIGIFDSSRWGGAGVGKGMERAYNLLERSSFLLMYALDLDMGVIRKRKRGIISPREN
eukprot:1340974-Amorphochlora_amoeboformis.AAC.2